MPGKQSAASIKRQTAEFKAKNCTIPKKPVDPVLSAKKRAACVKSQVKRGIIPPELEKMATDIVTKPIKIAQSQDKQAYEVLQNVLTKQNDDVATARNYLKSIAPDMAKRLGRVAMGQEPDFAPREQLQAMRLISDIVGLVSDDSRGSDDAPLTQRSVATLRAVIASGEQRIQELQAAIERQNGLDMGAIEGEHRTIDQVDDAAPCRAGTGDAGGDLLE